MCFLLYINLFINYKLINNQYIYIILTLIKIKTNKQDINICNIKLFKFLSK